MKLFKYTRINENTISALQNRYAWYSRPSCLNDPFDCGLVQSQMGGQDSWGVLSLSAVHDNVIMWSHYADSHRGICIAYQDYTDAQLADESVKTVINPYGDKSEELPIIRNAFPVRYLSTQDLNLELAKLPQTIEEFNDALKAYNESASTDPQWYRQGFVISSMKSLFIKHQDWSYEKEHRIIVQDGGKAIAAPGVVDTIYLGMNTPLAQCQQIALIAKQMNAKVLKMYRPNKRYELLSRELTDAEKAGIKPGFSRPINSHLSKVQSGKWPDGTVP